MSHLSGLSRLPVVLGLAVALCVAGLVLAQDATSTSQSSSKQGGATASSQATATSRSGSGQWAGGQAGAPVAVDPRPLYAAWYTDNRSSRPSQVEDSVLGSHYKYVKTLSLDGRVVGDGEFTDGTGLLLVFRAENDKAAADIVSRDPAVASRTFSVVLKDWRVVQGTLVGGGVVGAPVPGRAGGVVGAPGEKGGG
jgi:uncharacterized protein YciI